MSTPLYVGIDVSLNTSVVGILNQAGAHLAKPKTYRNNLPASQQLVGDLASVATQHSSDALYIATEATGFLDWHLLEYLATTEALTPYNPTLYRLNPRQVKAFSEISSKGDKTDQKDAFLIANFLRFQLPQHPFNANMDYVPLQRLTRFRRHLVEQITVEKNYFLDHLFLKFSAYRQVKPFSDPFGATSCAFMEEFFSLDEVAAISVEELLSFVIKHGKNRFPQPEEVVNELKRVARESYRIRPALAASVNLVIAQSLANIRALERSLKEVNKAIAKGFAGFQTTLETIPGMGPIYSAGIFAEIGNSDRFETEQNLARYAGLAWRKTQSGKFSAENTPLQRQSNATLRYYLVEAANSVKNRIPEYQQFYDKKYHEASKRRHKRALVLTARKLVRLIYVMLRRGEIYQQQKGKLIS